MKPPALQVTRRTPVHAHPDAAGGATLGAYGPDMLDVPRLDALRRQMEDLATRNLMLRAEVERHADTLSASLLGSQNLIRRMRELRRSTRQALAS